MRQHIAAALFVLFASLPMAVNSQTLPGKVQEVLSKALFVDGVVDREAHRVFWEELSKHDQNSVDRSIQWMRANTLLLQEYHHELWSSALISYRNNRVVKTEKLLELETTLSYAIKDAISYRQGTSQYSNSADMVDKGLSVAFQNAKNLLIAASTHSDFRGVKGEVIPLDEETILHVIENIGNVIARINLLFRKEWKE